MDLSHVRNESTPPCGGSLAAEGHGRNLRHPNSRSVAQTPSSGSSSQETSQVLKCETFSLNEQQNLPKR